MARLSEMASLLSPDVLPSTAVPSLSDDNIQKLGFPHLKHNSHETENIYF